jgi:hypothetical protein
MAEEALERAAARPSSISIHDDGYMLGHSFGLERGIDGALLRCQLVNAKWGTQR